jgi:lipopolysaccharide/colanic/teichoic acid biosynthesis glycosyltransferase
MATEIVVSEPLSATAALRRAEESTPPYYQPSRAGRLHVIDQRLFRGVLVRERKRADRSNQPLVLLLVRLSEPLGGGCSSIWRAVVGAMAAAKRDTDVLGWFERQAVIGLLVPDCPASSPAFARELAARLHRELVRRLDAQAIARVSVSLHAHPEPTGAADVVFRAVDPLLLKECSRGTRATTYDVLKRMLDVVGSAALLIALSPLLLLIAALVKLRSPGPVFFRQARVGQMMQPFTILKFRTMHVNASHAIHHEFVSSFIKSGVQAQEAGKKGLFKIASDPRVTTVGRILRKTSLDELPQLWNVLRGDMSLVGPRPPLQYEVQQYQPWHCRRVLEAKPGITGLWQVAGRSRTTFDEMVRLDLRYAKACSIWTDLKILLATPAAVIAGKGAC